MVDGIDQRSNVSTNENDSDDNEDEDGCISYKMFDINKIDLGKKLSLTTTCLNTNA